MIKMKPVLMFVTEWCPYWMDDIQKQNPAFTDIEIKIIDEELEPDIAKQYTYYYVPTYYVDGVKVHEGVASKNIITKVFEAAIK
jgi:thioredoxin 1